MDEYMENNNDKINTTESDATIENRLKSLQEKYDNLSKEVQSLKTICSSFEDINKNIADIRERLDRLVLGSDTDTRTNFNRIRMNSSLKNLIGNPLRRLAVGTLSGMYTVADKALESVYSIKENAEDIFAEAQYESKKKRMHTAEES
ncbi:hypothetical protein [Clostridium arbusti]|uniref:hypothetical protein n=1 Tax=Clostridium arbusti TaxID=1137848 RepID=UPI000289E7AA|nr:hypothetical protein [Clostridium arbusti]